jgi:hypothetical protein
VISHSMIRFPSAEPEPNGTVAFEYPVQTPNAGSPPIGGGGTPSTLAYPYDGHLKRVKNVSGNETIYSVYSKVSGKIALIDNATSGERFVLLNLGPVSVRYKPGGLVEYTTLDHLGSPVAATAANGALMWRRKGSLPITKIMRPNRRRRGAHPGGGESLISCKNLIGFAKFQGDC